MATSEYSDHCPPARPRLLSNTSSTLARPTGFLSPAPLKITSCMVSPRSAEARDSPSTQRTASITLDLPQPLGPTMPTRFPGSVTWVGSTKDLKPESLMWERRTVEADVVWGGSYNWGAILTDLPRRDNADQAQQAAGNLSQPRAAPGLPHSHGNPGVHLPVPEDRAAGFRAPHPGLRAGPAVRGAEEPQALRLVLPRARRVPRGGHQPHPRRPGEGDPPALHAPHRPLLRARRHLHHRGGGTPQEGLEAAVRSEARGLPAPV